MPGLDGLRAFAVAAVIVYHLGFSWAPGGLLGVGVFFTLSGYLITDLLLGSWEATGSLRLQDFWMRRAKRLLPGLFVMLAVVSVWAAIAQPSQLGPLRGDVAAAAAYVSNWWLMLQHVSYFARFGPPSPLGHLWSLAIEEQFYLLWPWLLLLGLVWMAARRRRKEAALLAQPGSSGAWPGATGPASPMGLSRAADLRALGYMLSGRSVLGWGTAEPQPFHARVGVETSARRFRLWPLAVVSLVIALGSAAEMALLYHPSFDPSRTYYGTDTRAFGLLIGAALAFVWPSRALLAKVTPRARYLLDGVGAASLLGIAALIWKTTEFSAFMYRGGMVVLSVATAFLVAVLAHPASRLARLMGCRPLRWAGVRSYGIYLWHYPVIVLTAPGPAAGTDLPRAVVQVLATLVLAELSWRFVESPVRRGALGKLWAQARRGGPYFRQLRPRSWAALGIVPAAVVLVSLGLAGALPEASPGTALPDAEPGTTNVTTPLIAPTTRPAPPPTTGPTTPITRAPLTTTTVTTTVLRPATTPEAVKTTTTAAVAPSPAPQKTSCREVVHLGDSTSESLVSSSYLPDPAQLLGAQYARVGVEKSIMEIEGGNSIVETLQGDVNAYHIAATLVHDGYRGCWVIALGTNDAADVYVGSNVGLEARIQEMMALIGKEPVMWVNVKTLLTTGAYSEAMMQRWDEALLAACPGHPNMRVFNWAGIAKPSWYIPDGIHYSSQGSAPMAAAIADALAASFPAGKPTARPPGTSCVVNASPAWHLPAFKM
jgi:peptidoglycan/LPS O-acetylase OafA/YrhL/lysophospholipase L1-like esterase